MELVPTSSAATYADLERLPPGMVGELLGGELFATPRPAPTHALVAGEMHGELWSRFQRATSGPGGWWILFEPELHLDGDVLVPDLAGWRVTTMPHVPTQQAFVDVVPDWVAEVASPTTAAWDRRRKLPRYYELGVGHVWLVTPETRSVDVFRHGPEGWYLAGVYSDEPDARIEPFHQAALDVARWWPT